MPLGDPPTLPGGMLNHGYRTIYDKPFDQQPVQSEPEATVAPSARELALESEVERLKAELKSTRRERNQFARQLHTLGEVLGRWAQDSTKHMRDESP